MLSSARFIHATHHLSNIRKERREISIGTSRVGAAEEFCDFLFYRLASFLLFVRRTLSLPVAQRPLDATHERAGRTRTGMRRSVWESTKCNAKRSKCESPRIYRGHCCACDASKSLFKQCGATTTSTRVRKKHCDARALNSKGQKIVVRRISRVPFSLSSHAAHR